MLNPAEVGLILVKLNSGLAFTEIKTENSDVVIFVKIIKEKTHENYFVTLHNKILTKLLKNKNYRTKDLFCYITSYITYSVTN